MPVKTKIASHGANGWNQDGIGTPAEHLRRSCPDKSRATKKIIQSSLTTDDLSKTHISASQHGLVRSIYFAYSCHFNLTLRPEDVWLSILNQVAFYIKAHAKELRSRFVAHDGQMELVTIDNATMETADFGDIAMRMGRLIEENVIDADLRSWMMPDFSTTTECDRIVASILMMGSVQQYFKYKAVLRCGIPSVELLGDREDWKMLLKKLDKLETLGKEPAQFAKLLDPIVRMFIATFDNPTSDKVRHFWNKCAHRIPGGSGPSFLSGWVTAFCFWNEDGKCLYPHTFGWDEAGCLLDGVKYHKVNIDEIPVGYSSVPVKVDEFGVIHEAMMVAGMVGIRASSSGEVIQKSGKAALDSIQPVCGWWMCELKEGK
ncbi:hypothetical protein MW887_003608 [Aspergillus wentii]|nr:hypothetical protein MW887_003608 [Aspergillus wentii]